MPSLSLTAGTYHRLCGSVPFAERIDVVVFPYISSLEFVYMLIWDVDASVKGTTGRTVSSISL